MKRLRIFLGEVQRRGSRVGRDHVDSAGDTPAATASKICRPNFVDASMDVSA